MKIKNISRLAVTLLGLMGCITSFPIASRAESVIFNDFGAGHRYNSAQGLTVAGTQSMPGFVEWGEAFTPNGRFNLTQITMGLGWLAGGLGPLVSV